MAAGAEVSRDADRQSDLAVMDANEYKQKRRLERILDAMDHIEDQANEAWDLFVNGEISHDAKNIMIQRAVKEAIRESYKLLLDHHRAIQIKAEDDKEESYSKYWIGIQGAPLGIIEREPGDPIVIWGLRDFLQSEELYYEYWTEQSKRRNMQTKQVEREEELTVPEKISWAASLRLREFLDDEHGMEIKFEEMDAQRPYDDWRDEFKRGVYHGPDSVELPHMNGGGDV